MYGLAYSSFVDFIRRDHDNFDGGSASSGTVLFALLAILLLIVVQLFVVQWLWNNVLVRVTSIARPIPSLLHVLGLLILIALVHPGCAVPVASAASSSA
jgi:hypothetical protein